MLKKFGASAALAFASACIVIASGCGGGGPPLVTVTGTVMLDNKPLEGAAIMFMPADPNNSHSAQDTTGADGGYRLLTGNRFGAVPGTYQVVITPAPPKPAGPVNPDFDDDPFMVVLGSSSGPGKSKKGKQAAPTFAEYTEVREITTETSQVHDFNVKAEGD